MNRRIRPLASLFVFCAILASFLGGTAPASARPPLCSSICTPTSNCTAVCDRSSGGPATTCGAWGECAYPPSCWSYTFLQIGSFFPNPGDNTTLFKASVNLAVLGTDSRLYPSTLSSLVKNGLGQTVYSATLGSFPSSPSFNVTVWNGKNNSGVGVASGVYNITVTSTSSLCGVKSFGGNVSVIN